MKIRKLAAVSLMALSLAAGTAFLSTALAADEGDPAAVEQRLHQEGGAVMPVGTFNSGYARYFTGRSYLSSLSEAKDIPVYNVTFENGAHTFWHVHHGTCQVLVAESGRGYYQIWGEAPHVLLPGQTVTIPEGVKHWHGAAPGHDFQHLSLMKYGEGTSNEWLEPVNEKDFNALK